MGFDTHIFSARSFSLNSSQRQPALAERAAPPCYRSPTSSTPFMVTRPRPKRTGGVASTSEVSTDVEVQINNDYQVDSLLQLKMRQIKECVYNINISVR